MSWFEVAARWYAVLVVCTWALAPAVRWLCSGLTDRGAALARPISLLAAVYPAWLLTSVGLIEFGTISVVITLVVLGAAGWILLVRRRQLDPEWLKCLVNAEIGSLLLFAAYLWLRGFTPEILGTEKPMDVAFLASSARTITIPPPDPWFAAEPINYYYLGYLIHGTTGRLAGIAPEIGFNLALATVFSTALVAAFGVVWNALRPSFGTRPSAVGGVLAAFFVMLAGNLYAPVRMVQNASETLGAWWWDSGIGIGWRSSRIVCDGPRIGNLCQFPSTETINEFPFFSLLLGDLHPHVMALPYTLVALGLAWNLARSGHAGTTAPGARRQGVTICLTGAIVGALYVMNAWDLPALLLLAVCALAASARTARRLWQNLFLFLSATALAWLPYYLTYDPPTSIQSLGLPPALEGVPVIPSLLAAIAVHGGERTSLGEYLTIFGVPYALGLALVIVTQWSETQRPSAAHWRSLVVMSASLVVSAALLAAPVILACGIPLVLAIRWLRTHRQVDARGFALAAISGAWILSIVVELVYIRDVFDDRMNTLFKFYYQAWTLYALAGAVAIVILWGASRQHSWQRSVMAVAVVMTLATTSVYPIVSAYQWTEGFRDWKGLDGLSYASATDPDDEAAIRWISQQAQPGDVVLEAAGCSYRPFGRLPFSRVSAFTGIPTVIGWADHERQWRRGQSDLLAEINQRQDDVASIFADPNSPVADTYGVNWIVVGEYELGNWQVECPEAGPYSGLDAPGYPASGWVEAFRSGDTRVYRRAGT